MECKRAHSLDTSARVSLGAYVESATGVIDRMGSCWRRPRLDFRVVRVVPETEPHQSMRLDRQCELGIVDDQTSSS
eukprot:5698630-Amphidinium_carterae.2